MTDTEHPQATAEAAAPERTSALPAIPSDALVLLPTRNLVLFPGLVTPLNVGRASSLAAVQEAARSNLRIGVVLQKDPSIDAPAIGDLHEVGTAASVLRYLTTP